VTLAAQQPENNIVRVALQGLAAVCGGTQSLHTNGFDEALALPTERAARIALRTQQILAHESGAADTADPFAGSYFVEALTDEIEDAAQALIDKIDEMGGSVRCIPFIRAEVEESAWGYEQRYKQKQDIVVGVNEYVTEAMDEVETLRVDPESERQQVERLRAFKSERDGEAVQARLEELRAACSGRDNLLVPMRAALAAHATLGEVCGVMRDEFGEYSEA
jgi:methylmalonyl-CoA mutase N-terminal domain/subunit